MLWMLSIGRTRHPRTWRWNKITQLDNFRVDFVDVGGWLANGDDACRNVVSQLPWHDLCLKPCLSSSHCWWSRWGKGHQLATLGSPKFRVFFSLGKSCEGGSPIGLRQGHSPIQCV